MSALIDTVLAKFTDRTAKVGVVGLGYVGLPFAVEKAKVGFKVTGIEQNSERAEKVNNGQNYIGDVDDAELLAVVTTGHIRAVTTFDCVADLDAIVICVPTPLTKNLVPDLRYVESVTRSISPLLRRGQLISLESTTYPGTTEELMLPILELSGLKVGVDFFLAHSPERVDPGNARYTTKNTNKVVGGVGPESLRVATAFYGQTIDHVVPVSSARAAEMVKVFENTYRAVNIALVNELTMLCDRMNLDVWEVLGAAFTKPFGIQPFWPGPGVGGHCIPLDPHYLEWKAKEYNFSTRFIALAGEINRRMPEFTIDKAVKMMSRQGVAIRGAKVLILGASYKKDIDDWRESPSLELIELLAHYGAAVRFHDPHVPEIRVGDKSMRSVELTDSEIESADLVLIATDHSTVDYQRIADLATRILDTRNAAKAVTDSRSVIVRL
jgi:UDP-N-acetyl-D-glucosamine dehydrogenase